MGTHTARLVHNKIVELSNGTDAYIAVDMLITALDTTREILYSHLRILELFRQIEFRPNNKEYIRLIIQ